MASCKSIHTSKHKFHTQYALITSSEMQMCSTTALAEAICTRDDAASGWPDQPSSWGALAQLRRPEP
jgi:hypothetical protein